MSEQAVRTTPSSPPKSPSREDEVSSLSPEALVAAVRKQVEYYFSKENLQQDAYLTSHMDANMAVPISVVMKFSKMKALTQDESVLVKALEGSSLTIVDGRIKASVRAGGRSTIILREIPSDAPEEEVRAIFAYDGNKPLVSVRSEIGDMWFVVMESEEDAKDTLIDLKLKKRTFRGQAVKGRMKSEAIVKSFYTVPSVPPVGFPGMPFPFPGPGMPMPMDMRAFGYGMMANGMPGMPGVPMMGVEPSASVAASVSGAPTGSADVSTAANGSSSAQKEVSGDSAEGATNVATKGTGAGRGDKKAASSGSAPTGGAAKSASGSSNTTSSGAAGSSGRKSGQSGSSNNQGGAKGGSGNASGRGEGDKEKKSGSSRSGGSGANSNKKDGKSSASSAPAIEISAANFPPLMVSQPADESDAIPTPGYKGPYVKYSFDEVINIVKAVQDTTLPATIKPVNHPLSMTVTPNLDLLQRQRTFSIDETREQLRQGRPVQQEAISTASSSDYSSMMYGEGYHAAEGASKSSAPAEASAAKAGKESTAKKAASGGSWAALVMSTAVSPTPAGAVASGQNATGLPNGGVAASAASVEKTAAAAPTAAPATANSGSIGDSSWKRGDKVSEKPAGGSAPSGDKRTGAAGTAASAPKREGGASGEKEKDRRKSGDKGSKKREEGSSREDDKTEAPSSWGGKPTFANVLKQQQEAEAAAAAEAGGAPAAVIAAPASPTRKPTSEAAAESPSRKDRSGSGSRNSGSARKSGAKDNRGSREGSQ